MIKVNFDTSSIADRIDKLKNLEELFTVSGIIQNKFEEIGQTILKALKEETPVSDDTRPDYHVSSVFHEGKEHLRDAWKWDIEVKGSVIEGFAYLESEELGHLVDLIEAGSPAHVIMPSDKKFLRFYVRDGGNWKEVYSKQVNHPGFRANKFLDRAFDKAKVDADTIKALILEEIDKVL